MFKFKPIPEQSQETRTPLRYLVLGSTGYGGVESVDWIEGELPNIVDHDIIIIDVPSLTFDKLGSADLKRFELIETQLIRFLFSGGTLIIITNQFVTHKRSNRYPEEINNYFWCPISIGIQKEEGQSIVIKREKLMNYLKKLAEWDYYLFIPNGWVKNELTKFYGPTYQTNYQIIPLPIVLNRYGKILAGSYHIQIRYQQTKATAYSGSYTEYPKKPDYLTGEIILLPRILGLDNRKAVDLILEEITGNPQRTLSPQWADEIILPGASSLISQIDEKRQQIRGLEIDIGRLNGEIDYLNEYKRLLYGTGSELENIVERCFNELGGKVIPAKYSQEEFVLIYAGNEYLIEVKGVSKSIALSHIRQLNDYLLRYEEEIGKSCKGILFSNAWCTLPPQNRNKHETIVFPNNVKNRAEQLDIALVSSTKFFEAFIYFLEHGQGDSLLTAITEQKGIIQFPVA